MAMAPSPFFTSARVVDGTRTGLIRIGGYSASAVECSPLHRGAGWRPRWGLAYRLGGDRGEPVQRGGFVAAVRADSAHMPDAGLPGRIDEQRRDDENRSTESWRHCGAYRGGPRGNDGAPGSWAGWMARRSSRGSAAISAPCKDTGSGALRRDSMRQPSVAQHDIPARVVAALRAIRRPDEGSPVAMISTLRR